MQEVPVSLQAPVLSSTISGAARLTGTRRYPGVGCLATTKKALAAYSLSWFPTMPAQLCGTVVSETSPCAKSGARKLLLLVKWALA